MTPATMQAVLMTAAGGPEVLQIASLPVPEPGPHDVRVRLRAAGVNPLDTKIRKLNFMYPDRLPAVLGCDGAGVVDRVGTEVTRFGVGDEVYFFNGGLGAAPGTYAQYTLVDEACAARKPAGLSMTEAAAIPLVLITAWEALVDRLSLRQGESVLIHAGAGGVGHLAVQLARHRGARIASTISGDDKAAFVEQLGAERLIDYRRADFVAEALGWTDGRGVDAVLDTVGGPAFCKAFAAARLYGRVATLLSTACELADVNRARLRNLSVHYVQMTAPSFFGDAEARRAQTRILELAAPLLADGVLRIHVSEVLPLRDAAGAHGMLEQGHTTGKVVLAID
jgi:NADPH:quinone reductase